MSVDAGSLNAAANAVTTGITKVSLHTGDPGAANDNEVSGNAYARADSTGSSWAETAGVSKNNAVVTFATPTGAWGTVRWMAAWAGTTRVFKQQLASPRNIEQDDEVTFPIGTITLTARNPAG